MSITLLDSHSNGSQLDFHGSSAEDISGIKREVRHSLHEWGEDTTGEEKPQFHGGRASPIIPRTKAPTVMNGRRRPAFEDLPLRSPDDPKASAWGLYGADDELGTLNILTPEIRRDAWQENKAGLVIPLNLPLDVPRMPMNPRRKPMVHNITAKGHANDDTLHINTQSSSHWDGLRHYPYQIHDNQKFYNDVSQADITGPYANTKLGIHNVARNGIAARAVLLDWRSYALQKNISYSPFETYGIPLSQLLEVAKIQGVKFKPGDVLLIRTGWTEEYYKLSPEEQVELAERSVRASCGVEATREMLKWHWDMAFSAVASDTNAYEAWPSPKPWGVSCHEVLLSGWGMPIGEVWDLESLAAKCKELGRWEFYLVSSPLNVPAGVASPSNALALL